MNEDTIVRVLALLFLLCWVSAFLYLRKDFKDNLISDIMVSMLGAIGLFIAISIAGASLFLVMNGVPN